MSGVADRSGLGGGAEPRTDDQLVDAARRGDDRAFEALYARYHARVAGYVLAMVKDHGRAEDITQEVFLSALRRMRATERPLVFEPWIYAIARHACIDEFRRARRSPEVSLDVVEPGDLRGTAAPEHAVLAKQDLHHLRGAFGGLSDTYHEVLVLRELEGLSYAEIGERVGMSRAAVESTLFRARRRLAEEYEELATGARCRRMQRTISLMAGVRLGARELNRLARHVSHCQPCRRAALAAGIDPSILTYVPLRRRAAGKVAALLPVPDLGWLHRGRGRADEAAASLAGSPGGGLAANAPFWSEQLNAGWAKPAAIVVALVAGAGAGGVGTKVATGEDDRPATRERPAPESQQASVAPSVAGGGAAAQAAETPRLRVTGGRTAGRERDRPARGDDTRGRRDGERRTRDGGTPAPGDAPTGAADTGGGAAGGNDQPARHAPGGDAGGDGGDAGGDGGDGGGTPEAPSTDPPAQRRADPLKPVVDGVTRTVDQTLRNTTETVQGVNDTVENVNETVQGVTDGLDDTVENVTDGLDGVLDGLLGGSR